MKEAFGYNLQVDIHATFLTNLERFLEQVVCDSRLKRDAMKLCLAAER